MNFVHLTVELQMKNLLKKYYSDCYAELKKFSSHTQNPNAIAAVSLLCTQLIMQQVVNEMAKNDSDPDRSIANEALSLIVKQVNSFLQNDNSTDVKRLSLRFQKLKSITCVGKMEYNEYYYWFQWGLGMDKSEIDGKLTSIVNWIIKTVEEAQNFIKTESPIPAEKHSDGQIHLDLH